MKTFERHVINASNVVSFMIDHADEAIIFREMYADNVCIDVVRELSKAEFNMVVLNKLLIEESVHITDEEVAAIEYAIECIKTLDDMGIIKENKGND